MRGPRRAWRLSRSPQTPTRHPRPLATTSTTSRPRVQKLGFPRISRNSFGNKVPPADSHFRKFPRKYACSGRNCEQNFPGYARAVALWRPLWCSAAAGEKNFAPNRPVFVKSTTLCVSLGLPGSGAGADIEIFGLDPHQKTLGTSHGRCGKFWSV